MHERKIVNSLSDLCNIFNLRPNIPIETIVTIKEGNSVHASAMGLWIRPPFIILKPYKTSRTLQLLLRSKICIINFVYDIQAFVVSALKAKLPGYQLETVLEGEKYVRLINAIAWIETTVIDTTDKEAYMKVRLDFVKGEVSDSYYAWCRSDFLILEALIKTTRLSIYRGTEKENILKKEIIQLSQECLRITSNATKEKAIFDLILTQLSD